MTSTVIKNIANIFEGADQHDWSKIHSVMADKILLDYTSMTGGEPTLLSPQEITTAWANFLPGFDKTHHQLSNFKTETDGAKIYITFDGTADHLIADKVWTVIGDYYAEAQQDGKISLLKFNFKQAIGDTTLPEKAINQINAKRVKK